MFRREESKRMEGDGGEYLIQSCGGEEAEIY